MTGLIDSIVYVKQGEGKSIKYLNYIVLDLYCYVKEKKPHYNLVKVKYMASQGLVAFSNLALAGASVMSFEKEASLM